MSSSSLKSTLHSLLDERIFRNYLIALYSPVVFLHLRARCSAADDGALCGAAQRWADADGGSRVDWSKNEKAGDEWVNGCWQLHNQGNSVVGW